MKPTKSGRYHSINRRIIRHLSWMLIGVIACVSPLDDRPQPFTNAYFFVDGNISNEPGPYQVRLTKNSNIYSDLYGVPFSAAKVTIVDDLGNPAPLKPKGDGIYFSDSTTFRGEIGRAYQLQVEDNEGNLFESSFEKITEPGRLDSIYYQFNSFKPQTGPTRYGFKIFANATTDTSPDTFIRWKYLGTYKIRTYPELRVIVDPNTGDSLEAPAACSFREFGGGFSLSNCECCICWLNEFEDVPTVREGQATIDGRIVGVEVGYVPINGLTFMTKFLVKVSQMSLTRSSFEYFSVIQNQVTGAGSLFQVPGGSPPTNIKHVNGNLRVEGLFYSSGVASKEIYLTSRDVAAHTEPPDPFVYKEDCRLISGSGITNVKPKNWKD